IMAAKRRKSTSLFATAVILIILFAVGFELLQMHEKLAAAQGEQAIISQRLSRQRQENRTLEAALERADDPEFLQQLAREQLGMVSPGEKDFYDVSH
ncbi:MAG: septum formation initiator family protein, partial [Oscillospiraceae bacterium]|nr:septum formation initiator family protein [Oscillospiraceae bacterium]